MGEDRSKRRPPSAGRRKKSSPLDSQDVRWGTHRVVSYRRDWTTRFAQIAAALRAVLPAGAVIEHYGSTSVPGLGGRPIVDIQIAVVNVVNRASFEHALHRLGYELFAPPDMKPLAEDGMLIYVPSDGSNSVHLAVCTQGGFHNRRQLAVRDYLRAHPEQAAAYETVKRNSATTAKGDRQSYASGKAAFVIALQDRALTWRASNATEGSPSG